MQTIGRSPAARAATARRLTPSSVSPNSWRRSEWPIITHWHATVNSIRGATSPVNAPSSSQWQFCAPRVTPLPFSAAATAPNVMYDGQTTTSIPSVASATSGSISAIKAEPASRERFIFQLPATSGRRTSASPCGIRSVPHRDATDTVIRGLARGAAVACDQRPSHLRFSMWNAQRSTSRRHSNRHL